MFFTKKDKNDELDFLSLITASRVDDTSRGSRVIIWVIMGFVLCAAIWASFAQVQEIIRGEGKIIPSRHVQVIQSLEGGIVADIPVKAGDIVDQGQVLIKLNNKKFESNLGENTVDLNQMKAKAVRLYAESHGVSFDSAVSALGLGDITPGALADERNLFEKNMAYDFNDAGMIREQIRQIQIRSTELRKRISSLNESLALNRKEMSMTEPLIYSGAASQVDILKLKKEANDITSEIESDRIKIQENDATVAEYTGKLHQVGINSRGSAQKDFNDVMAAIGKTSQTIKGVKDQVDRGQIKSPVKGVVKQLYINTIGGVITPGMDIMEVVPLEDKLVVEAKIKPSDIAFIKTGDKALIKFTAFDFSIYGGLDAVVTYVSPDTTVEDKAVFYTVRLQTDRNYISKNGQKHKIMPGMIVQADIITGKKTVMQYILKPLIKARHDALTEK